MPILDAAFRAAGHRRAGLCPYHANRTGQILCFARAMATAAALFPDGAPSGTIIAGYWSAIFTRSTARAWANAAAA